MTLETANRLYELRKKHNLSQEELAEKLGVSRQAVSKWERSEASPDTDNLIALAKIYDLSLDELIYGEKEAKNEEKNTKTEESQDTTSSESKEEGYINVEDGENKIKIDRSGILVESEDGETVKIKLSGGLMDMVIKKIEDGIEEADFEVADVVDPVDIDDDELYETVFEKNGETKKGNKYHVKITKPAKFWLEVPYAVICALLYLICGFENLLGGWSLSWVIFITVPIYYSLVEAIYKRRFSEFAYPVLTAFIYLVCGLYFDNWHPSWLIFITVAIYYPIAEALDKVMRNR